MSLRIRYDKRISFVYFVFISCMERMENKQRNKNISSKTYQAWSRVCTLLKGIVFHHGMSGLSMPSSSCNHTYHAFYDITYNPIYAHKLTYLK